MVRRARALRRGKQRMLDAQTLDCRDTVLVCLPGAGCTPDVFADLALPGLAVHAIDWSLPPGPWHVPAIAQRLHDALLRRRGPTLLAGYSLGGVIALQAAARSGSPVAGLLLSNTGASMARHGDGGLPARIRAGWSDDGRDAFLRSCFHRPPPAALWEKAVAFLAQIDEGAMLEAIESLRATDLRGVLGRVRCPTVIAHGVHDRRRTLEDARELAAGIPGATLIELDAGHTPMVEDRDGYAAALSLLTDRVRSGSD